MAMLDLPNEVLTLVATFLDRERDIYALARTNRRLLQLIHPYLVQYDIRYEESMGLRTALFLPTELAPDLFFREEKDELHEYSNPSEPVSADGLPLPVTPSMLERDARLRVFKENGAVLDGSRGVGGTTIWELVLARMESSFWLMVRHGLDCSMNSGYDKKTLLHYAAASGCVRIIRYLIAEKKIDADCREWKLKTPLHYATICGRDAAIRTLLDHGADVDACDSDGWTAMHQIVVQSRPESNSWGLPALRTLIAAGANIHARSGRDRDGKTPLHAAVVHGNGRNCEMVKVLLQSGVEVDARDEQGQSALYCAVTSWNAQAARLLVENGADVNTRNNQGYSLLYAAARNDLAHEIPYFVENGADMEADIGIGRDIVEYLEQMGNQEVIEQCMRVLR